MKKLLSTILATTIVLSSISALGFSANAKEVKQQTGTEAVTTTQGTTASAELSNAFLKYCENNLRNYSTAEENKKVTITETLSIGNMVVFRGSSWVPTEELTLDATIGDYVFQVTYIDHPYCLGLYVYKNNNIYSLEEAYYTYGFITDLSQLSALKTVSVKKAETTATTEPSTSNTTPSTEPATEPQETTAPVIDNNLKEAFKDYCIANLKNDTTDPSNKNVEIEETLAVGDMIVFRGASWVSREEPYLQIDFGEYTIEAPYINHPYYLGLYVYKNNKIYTLDEAIDNNILTDLSPLMAMKTVTVKKSDIPKSTDTTETAVASTSDTTPITEPATVTEPQEATTSPEATTPTITKVVPAKVKNFKATAKSKSSIKLTWKKNSHTTSYVIYRSYKKTNGKYTSYKKIKTLKKSSTTYTNKKLKKNTTYKYKIVAYNKTKSYTTHSKASVVKAKTKKK